MGEDTLDQHRILDVRDDLQPFERPYRITTALSGAFTAAREGARGKRLDCVYYEEQGKLRIIVNAELEFAYAVLSLVNFLLTEGSLG